ncbi:MAG TPA: hypothetical protein VGH13_12880 [Xanthobacteraceae bacterium]|jgi:hypothetical protein
MNIPRITIVSVVALCASFSAAHAASCSNDIDHMQARIDANVEAIAAAGPAVPPGIGAGMGVQPTPFGIATVEEKMGELKRSTFDAVHDAMTRARAANSAGKYKACEKALADVRRLMPAGLQTASSRQKH